MISSIFQSFKNISKIVQLYYFLISLQNLQNSNQINSEAFKLSINKFKTSQQISTIKISFYQNKFSKFRKLLKIWKLCDLYEIKTS